MSSANYLGKEFGPGSGWIRFDKSLGLIRVQAVLTLGYIVLCLKELFENKYFEEKSM